METKLKYLKNKASNVETAANLRPQEFIFMCLQNESSITVTSLIYSNIQFWLMLKKALLKVTEILFLLRFYNCKFLMFQNFKRSNIVIGK